MSRSSLARPPRRRQTLISTRRNSMRSKLLAVGVSALAMALPSTAMATGSDSGTLGSVGSGGAGQAQQSAQASATLQDAGSQAKALQNAVNTNAPVNVAGGDVSGGDNTASQTATNGAHSHAGNNANTNQNNTQSQSTSSGCVVGCGGSGQAQGSSQWSKTLQGAGSKAD